MVAAEEAGGGGSRSLVKILSNIFISFIGAGILGLPYAFKESGIVEGILIMSIVGIVSTKAMLLIIDCKYVLLSSSKYQRLRTTEPDLQEEGVEVTHHSAPSSHITYGDVGYSALGSSGKALVDLAIVVSQIGFSCAYLIFIIHNLGSYLPNVRDWQFLLFLFPLLFGLTLFRRLGSLGYFSLFAQVSNLLAFVVVLWFDFAHLAHVSNPRRAFNVDGLPFFAAVSIYCYEGAGMILSLEGSVHETRRSQFKKYFISTMIVVTLMYTSFGVCGYMSFGQNTNPIITLNLPRGSSVDFALIVKACLCTALALTYPVMMFPVTQILESLLKIKKRLCLGNLLRLCLVTIGCVVVLLIPNFANLMALIGASCCTLLAFILPGVFHLRLVGRSGGIRALFIDFSLIAVGILGMIIGLLDALDRMESESEKHQKVKLNATELEPAVRAILRPWTPTTNLSVS